MEAHSLSDTLDKLLAETEDQTKVSIRDILTTFKHRGFGPLILVPALIGALPTGMIPGVPSVCASMVLFMAIQQLFGKTHPWLPERIKDSTIKRSKLQKVINQIDKPVKQVDNWIGKRAVWITSDVGNRLTALLCVGLACAVIPLELVPMAALVPLSILTILGLGITTRDGALILVGFVLSACLAIALGYLLI